LPLTSTTIRSSGSPILYGCTHTRQFAGKLSTCHAGHRPMHACVYFHVAHIHEIYAGVMCIYARGSTCFRAYRWTYGRAQHRGRIATVLNEGRLQKKELFWPATNQR
jgi:hypothetical protein